MVRNVITSSPRNAIGIRQRFEFEGTATRTREIFSKTQCVFYASHRHSRLDQGHLTDDGKLNQPLEKYPTDMGVVAVESENVLLNRLKHGSLRVFLDLYS